MMTRSTVLREVGIFDPEQFIYWDDISWCAKVRERGYKVAAISAAEASHAMSASSPSTTLVSYFYLRNRIRYFLPRLSDEKVADFSKIIATGLARSTFFSELRGQPQKAQAQWWALNDLLEPNTAASKDRIINLPEDHRLREMGFNEEDHALLFSTVAQHQVLTAGAMLSRVFKKVDLLDVSNGKIKKIKVTESAVRYGAIEHKADVAIYLTESLSDAADISKSFPQEVAMDVYGNLCWLSDAKAISNAAMVHEENFLRENLQKIESKLTRIKTGLSAP